MQRLLRAPTWAIGLLAGAPFGIMIAITIKVSGDTMPAALIGGGAAGLLMGVALAFGTRTPRRDLRQALAPLPVADWKAARTAAWRGPVPTRTDIRATALDLVDLRLRNLRRARPWMTVVFGLNLAIAVLNIVVGNRFGVLLAVLWTAGLIEQWHSPRRFRRRRQLLATD
ncbi:hypothetical protein [Kribbella sp. DT2]|uniref:hypothetical protein n=1 Tax=Kribbella sp. DT2 TaxID=3393427 RepID=UPI003CEFD3EC